MEFEPSDTQRKLYQEILTAVGSLDACEPTARDQWQRAADLHLTGLCLPRKHGGLGLGALDTALCLEAFGRGCPDTGLVFAVAAHLLACAVPIRDFLRSDWRDELLAGLAGGDIIAANAVTEDEAGSDVGRLQTTARRVNDHYVLDGEKSFASNAPLADVLMTYAVTDPRAGFLGISAFAVPTALPGVEVSAPLRKLGLHGCQAGRVRFSACRVPVRCRVGDEGQGSIVFQHSMGWERSCLFAFYIGVMQEQLSRCIAHARQRKQFGRRIGDNQAVSHMLATMKQRMESARLLLYRACWAVDEAHPEARVAAALSKVAVSEAAVANALDAVQIFGGAGYLIETGVEHYLRDALPGQIFSGTNQIQREIIAREIGL